MLSITVVDGIPLPYGEEFTGVIRAQDVRATEKDKVKIQECFRGGDVVKGLVVCLIVPDESLTTTTLSFRLATAAATLSQQHAMI